MEDNDADLLARYRDGNTQALEQMVERYRRPLFGFILNMIGRREEAEEVFQEVWFRAIRNINKYRDDKFVGWLFRIARNCIIDRSRARKQSVSFDRANEAGISLLDTTPGKDESPAAETGNREIRRKITAAVAALPAEQREVFLMRMEGGLAFKEIAGIQRVSINTALARMQYALSKLRNELKDEYNLYGR